MATAAMWSPFFCLYTAAEFVEANDFTSFSFSLTIFIHPSQNYRFPTITNNCVFARI